MYKKGPTPLDGQAGSFYNFPIPTAFSRHPLSAAEFAGVTSRALVAKVKGSFSEMSIKGSSEHIFELQITHSSSPNQSNSYLKACEAFGFNLNNIRNRLGLLPEQVAGSLNILEEGLAKIEAGRSDQVDFDLIVKIKAVLDVKYAELLKGIT